MNNRKLVLENGKVFEGVGFGAEKEVMTTITFNTSVVGYQEILSDPVNYNNIMCMTYPVIGSYGLNDEDYESKQLTVSGLIVKEYNDQPSNFRFTHKLDEVMDESNVPGISGIDTRELTRVIRDNGIMKALICDINKSHEECMNEFNKEVSEDLVAEVSTKKVWYSRTHNPVHNVVVIDLGVRKSLVKTLNKVGCNAVVVPYNSTIETILKYKPDGILLSDGPGNPENYHHLSEIVTNLKKKLPIIGVGLGTLIIARAYGAETRKLKVGHNGCNLPVKNIDTNKIEITTQNSYYEIVRESIDNAKLSITHINVIDNEVKGIYDSKSKVKGVLYNPSIAADECLIRDFVVMMKNFGGKKNAKKN